MIRLIKDLYKAYQDYKEDLWIFKESQKGLIKYHGIMGSWPKTVIDIGAHRGGVSLYALKKGAEKVFAIEPALDNFLKLCINLKRYMDNDRIFLLNKAFSNTNELIKPLYMYAPGNRGQNSLMYNNRDKVLKKCMILYVNTIDLLHVLTHDYLKDNTIIDYFKLDIEGGEYKALPIDDLTRSFFDHIRFIDIEFHPLKAPFFIDAPPGVDVIKQYLEFFHSCGFLCDIRNYENGYKLCTFNRNMKI